MYMCRAEVILGEIIDHDIGIKIYIYILFFRIKFKILFKTKSHRILLVVYKA